MRVFLAILFTLFPTFTIASVSINGQARVIDGDTLAIGEYRIRLHGIDAPELSQICTSKNGMEWACGKTSADKLRLLINDENVNCTQVDKDRYGRIVARCETDGIDLNQTMVSIGMAMAYTRYSQEYVVEEKASRLTQTGIWDSKVQAPSEYRKQRRRNNSR